MTIKLNLPPELQEYLRKQAQKKDCTLEAYVEQLLSRDAEQDDIQSLGGPPSLSPRTREELDRMLIEGLESPRSEMTKADWEQMHAEIDDRVAKHKPDSAR